MAAIRGRDTKPELIIRKGLHARGFRFRLHGRDLPGRPDLIFPKYRVLIWVHGCFWHGHDCPMFHWPKSRQEFWRAKIGRNRERDAETWTAARASGWRCGTVWECALKGRGRLPPGQVIDLLARWLSSDAEEFCIEGQWIDIAAHPPA